MCYHYKLVPGIKFSPERSRSVSRDFSYCIRRRLVHEKRREGAGYSPLPAVRKANIAHIHISAVGYRATVIARNYIGPSVTFFPAIIQGGLRGIMDPPPTLAGPAVKRHVTAHSTHTPHSSVHTIVPAAASSSHTWRMAVPPPGDQAVRLVHTLQAIIK